MLLSAALFAPYLKLLAHQFYWVSASRDLDTLQWRHNGRDGVSNHRPRDRLLNRLFRRRSKKASKLHVTGLCAGTSPGTGEFPAQMASNVENASIWWRHHEIIHIDEIIIILLPFTLKHLERKTIHNIFKTNHCTCLPHLIKGWPKIMTLRAQFCSWVQFCCESGIHDFPVETAVLNLYLV